MTIKNEGEPGPPHYYDHDEDWSWRTAKAFPLWSSHSPREYDRLLQLLLSFGIKPETLLDVGCGAGRFGVHASAAGFDYLGVDDSRAGILLGQSSYPGIALDVCDFVQPLPDSYRNRFQVVASINAAHCIVEIPDRLQFFVNMLAALQSGGMVALTTMCAPVAEGFRLSKRPRVHRHAYEILSEMRSSGMRIIHFDVRGPYATSKVSNLTVIGTRANPI